MAAVIETGALATAVATAATSLSLAGYGAARGPGSLVSEALSEYEPPPARQGRSLQGSGVCTLATNQLGDVSLDFDGEIVNITKDGTATPAMALGGADVKVEGKKVIVMANKPADFTMDFETQEEADKWAKAMQDAAAKTLANHERISQLRSHCTTLLRREGDLRGRAERVQDLENQNKRLAKKLREHEGDTPSKGKKEAKTEGGEEETPPAEPCPETPALKRLNAAGVKRTELCDLTQNLNRRLEDLTPYITGGDASSSISELAARKEELIRQATEISNRLDVLCPPTVSELATAKVDLEEKAKLMESRMALLEAGVNPSGTDPALLEDIAKYREAHATFTFTAEEHHSKVDELHNRLQTLERSSSTVGPDAFTSDTWAADFVERLATAEKRLELLEPIVADTEKMEALSTTAKSLSLRVQSLESTAPAPQTAQDERTPQYLVGSLSMQDLQKNAENLRTRLKILADAKAKVSNTPRGEKVADEIIQLQAELDKATSDLRTISSTGPSPQDDSSVVNQDLVRQLAAAEAQSQKLEAEAIEQEKRIQRLEAAGSATVASPRGQVDDRYRELESKLAQAESDKQAVQAAADDFKSRLEKLEQAGPAPDSAPKGVSFDAASMSGELENLQKERDALKDELAKARTAQESSPGPGQVEELMKKLTQAESETKSLENGRASMQERIASLEMALQQRADGASSEDVQRQLQQAAQDQQALQDQLMQAQQQLQFHSQNSVPREDFEAQMQAMEQQATAAVQDAQQQILAAQEAAAQYKEQLAATSQAAGDQDSLMQEVVQLRTLREEAVQTAVANEKKIQEFEAGQIQYERALQEQASQAQDAQARAAQFEEQLLATQSAPRDLPSDPAQAAQIEELTVLLQQRDQAHNDTIIQLDESQKQAQGLQDYVVGLQNELARAQATAGSTAETDTLKLQVQQLTQELDQTARQGADWEAKFFEIQNVQASSGPLAEESEKLKRDVKLLQEENTQLSATHAAQLNSAQADQDGLAQQNQTLLNRERELMEEFQRIQQDAAQNMNALQQDFQRQLDQACAERDAAIRDAAAQGSSSDTVRAMEERQKMLTKEFEDSLANGMRKEAQIRRSLEEEKLEKQQLLRQTEELQAKLVEQGRAVSGTLELQQKLRVSEEYLAQAQAEARGTSQREQQLSLSAQADARTIQELKVQLNEMAMQQASSSRGADQMQVAELQGKIEDYYQQVVRLSMENDQLKASQTYLTSQRDSKVNDQSAQIIEKLTQENTDLKNELAKTWAKINEQTKKFEEERSQFWEDMMRSKANESKTISPATSKFASVTAGVTSVSEMPMSPLETKYARAEERYIIQEPGRYIIEEPVIVPEPIYAVQEQKPPVSPSVTNFPPMGVQPNRMPQGVTPVRQTGTTVQGGLTGRQPIAARAVPAAVGPMRSPPTRMEAAAAAISNRPVVAPSRGLPVRQA